MPTRHALEAFHNRGVLDSCCFMSVHKGVIPTGYEDSQHYVAFSIGCCVSTKTLICKCDKLHT